MTTEAAAAYYRQIDARVVALADKARPVLTSGELVALRLFFRDYPAMLDAVGQAKRFRQAVVGLVGDGAMRADDAGHVIELVARLGTVEEMIAR